MQPEQAPIPVTQFSLEPAPREAYLRMALLGAEAVTRKSVSWGDQQAETSETASQTSERHEHMQVVLEEFQEASNQLGDIVTEFSELFARRDDLIGRANKVRGALVESHTILSDCLVAEDNFDAKIASAKDAHGVAKDDYMRSLGRQYANRHKAEDDTLDLNERIQAAYDEYPYAAGGYQTEVTETKTKMATALSVLESLREQLTTAKGTTFEEEMTIDRHLQTIIDLQAEADQLNNYEEGLLARQGEVYRRMGVLTAQLQQQIPGGRRRRQDAQESAQTAIEATPATLPEQRTAMAEIESTMVVDEPEAALAKVEAPIERQPVEYSLTVESII